MKKVIILGKGYVGAALDPFLRARNIDVVSFKRSELDYTKPLTLQKYIKDNRENIELIINCAGYTGSPNVDACESNKQDCWFWNVIVPRNIVLSANTFNLPVINVSSGCIYSGYDKEYTEQDEPNFGLFNNQSSFYSKTKHACETILTNCYAYTLRIRMPFDGTLCSKNYINKLYKYNNLISEKNSVTSMTDLNEFIHKMLFFYKHVPAGPINVINPGAVTAETIVDMLKRKGIENKNWNFIDLKNLNTVANRSNCVLSGELLKTLNLELPPAEQSLERDISEFAKNVLSK